MHLEFFGAAGEVTGSCHILRVGRSTLLLDCGMIQGGDSPDERNREPFPFDPSRVDAVILSHAHIDHCGRLPLLRKRGFRGPIHATSACRDLAQVLLADSASLAERDAERESRKQSVSGGRPRIEPLYSVADAADTMRRFVAQPYDRTVEVLPGVRVTFHDAGHILGSASVVLELEENGRRWRVLFSGDIGQYDSPILRDPEVHDAVDVVLMESTYGNRRHRERAQTLEELGSTLLAAGRDGGNVLMPAFAVGRSQDILYEFATHFDAWQLQNWRIFLDSPMAIEASRIYWAHPDLYDTAATAARQRITRMPPIPNLEFTRTAEQSMAINHVRSGAIIIAGSGMCTGGRIVHHLKHNIGRPECHIVFTGFQAQGTLGRAIVDRRETVRIHGEPHQVKARVHTLGGFSAHGDQEDLLRWYSGLPGRPDVWLVHGESDGAEGLQTALRAQGVHAEIARPGLRIEPGAPA